MNNKSRIALAIAAALGVSSGAMAQTSTVQIGGSFNLFVQKATSTGGPNASLNGTKGHDNLSLSEPEMWVHGEERIGGNTVYFRCTSSFDLMGTSASSTTTGGVTTTPSAGQFCGRNSALGLKGSFGNVFVGTWDVANKLVYNQIRGWWGGTASLTGASATVLLGGSGSNTGNSGATFFERRNRSLNYHSPIMNGFQLTGTVSAANEATIQSTAATMALTPRLLSLSAHYTNGPLYVGLGWEQHKDHNPASRAITTTRLNTAGTSTTVSTTVTISPALGSGTGEYNGGTDSNYTVGARYTIGATRLSGLYTKTTYDVTVGTTATKSGYALFVDHDLGRGHSLKGQYYKTGDTKGNAAIADYSTGGGASATTPKLAGHSLPGANTGADGWGLAYMYQFSKRTQAGFVYSVLNNDANSSYSKGVNTAAPGSTQRGYGLNVRHSF